jgi:hypothetical protein
MVSVKDNELAGSPAETWVMGGQKVTMVAYLRRFTKSLQLDLQALVTPSQRHFERNQKVPGRPGLVGAAMEAFGFSTSVSQRELRELEGAFPKVELHASCKTPQICD